MPSRLQSLHPAFSLAGGLMGILRPIVQVPVLPMFHRREHLPLRGRIAFQPIGDDHSRDVPTAVEELPKERLGGCFVPVALYQNIEHGTLLIDGPPEVVPLPMNREKDLIQMPLVAWPRTTAELIGVLSA
jgi:hypothetical protein